MANPNNLQRQQPTKMVSMKPIGLRGMIESAMAMKRKKDETLQACCLFDNFWLWIKGL
jgi:hypothetical protein